MDVPYQFALASDHWVQALPTQTREAFVAAIRARPYPAGAEIFAQGDAAVAYYGILSGEARFTKITADGRQSTLAQLGPGEWFGELSFLDEAPRMHDAHAAGGCVLAVVAAGDMRRLLARHGSLKDGLIKQLARHTRQLYAAVDDLLLMTPDRLLAKRITERMAGGTTEILMKQDDLAGLIGVSRQSMNRTLRLWEDAGLIRRAYGKIIILDRQAIAARAA